MWSSIEQIIKPDSISEARVLQKETGSSIFAGGSYLVSQKDPNISTLIDINHLLNYKVESLPTGLQIGAACTLQNLLHTVKPNLADAILGACPSKNIRNQRTLGGEIAEARSDSDLLVYLHAAEAQLQLGHSKKLIRITDWEGDSIISSVNIPNNNTKIQRVAVLDSAPAFVIVAMNMTDDFITLAVGGKSKRIIYCKTPISPAEQLIRTFMDKVEMIFENDHFGSPAYKRQLVSNLLYEMTVPA